MKTATNYDELNTRELLEAATQAGVALTIDCQCRGIFVNNRQFVEKVRNVNGHTVEEGYWYGNYQPDGPPPEGVSANLLDALMARSGELEKILQAAGAWSCGCEVGLTLEQLAEKY